MGVGESGGGEGQQAQYPGGGLRQGVVDEPEGARKRAGADGLLFVGVGQLAQLPRDIGDRGHGVGGEHAAHQGERRGCPRTPRPAAPRCGGRR